MKKIVIIGIGNGYEHQLDWIYDVLPTKELINMFLDKQIDVYDIMHYPEKGDAIDEIVKNHKDIAAVIAVHIFGMKKGSAKSANHDYFYNVRNDELLEITNALNIPLIVIGDQPDGKNAFSKTYNM